MQLLIHWRIFCVRSRCVTGWRRAPICARGREPLQKLSFQNKLKRNPDPKAALDTTWISDKYAYPLQIANIALTSIEMLDTPINLFQKNVFELKTGDDVVLKIRRTGLTL